MSLSEDHSPQPSPALGWRLSQDGDITEPPTDRMPDTTEDLSGVMAGNYRLVRRLGVGGLASVWLGEHPVIGSRVAVKVLHPDVWRSREATRRFVMEAQAVNRINCPRIVRIFDFGCLPGGRDYAVMELLEGETLADRVARGPLSWSEARSVVEQVLHAVVAAHQAGIAHRDLKPENIHLGDAPEPDVKVLDFGIAKLFDSVRPGTTHENVCLGTPSYAAPEQLRNGPIGPATDIYACGELLYEMLTGKPLFGGPLRQMVRAKLTAAPRSVGEEVPGLPRAVVRLIDAMLSLDPAERPSAGEVLEVLAGAEGTVLAQVDPAGVEPERSMMDTLPGAPPAMLQEVDLFRDVVWGAAAHEVLPPLEPGRRCGTRPWVISGCVSLGVVVLGIAGWLLLGAFHGGARADAGTGTSPAAASPAAPAERPAPAVRQPPATPVTHVVRFTSRPAGALVRIDGRPVGRTPLRLELEQGDGPLEVTFVRRGYRRARRHVHVDRARVVQVSLEKRAPSSPRRRPGHVDWVDPF